MSILNKWDYSNVDEVCYSDAKQESYIKASKFLGDSCEDWGCGTGWAKRYFKNYKGIDASPAKYVDVVTDLSDYISSTDNILMREVLEYNENWKKILDNVKKSFNKKLCLIISTPLVDKTHISYVSKNGIKEHSFNKQDILNELKEYKVKEEIIKTSHLYGQDLILYVEKITS